MTTRQPKLTTSKLTPEQRALVDTLGVALDPATPLATAANAVEELIAALHRSRAARVHHARANGISWADIGHALGLSKQAVHRMYGKGAA